MNDFSRYPSLLCETAGHNVNHLGPNENHAIVPGAPWPSSLKVHERKKATQPGVITNGREHIPSYPPDGQLDQERYTTRKSLAGFRPPIASRPFLPNLGFEWGMPLSVHLEGSERNIESVSPQQTMSSVGVIFWFGFVPCRYVCTLTETINTFLTKRGYLPGSSSPGNGRSLDY